MKMDSRATRKWTAPLKALSAGLLLLSAAPAAAFSEIQTLYPASFCNVGTYPAFVATRVGMGQYFGGGDVTAFCPIVRMQPTWESVVVVVDFDWTVGADAHCTLFADPKDTQTTYVGQNVDTVSMIPPDDMWLAFDEIGAPDEGFANPEELWSDFSGASSKWATLRMNCGGSAPVLGYYVFEYTLLN